MDISRIGALKTTKIPVVKARYLFSSNQEMIDTMRGKAALLGIALMVLCAAVIGNVTAETPEESGDKLIHVSGTGKVTTTPDQAIIVLAVEIENADAKVAQ